jgi:GNAT superfamily N-acetyltransferase
MDKSPDIRPLENRDYQQWLPLWEANNQNQCPPEITEVTWARLIEPEFPVSGLGAWAGERLSGICHYVIHPTTGSIEPVCYMQDLFVENSMRRKGIAGALVKELEKRGQEQGWKRIYWLAEEQNEAARRLYNNIGVKISFNLYVLPLS